MVDTLYLIQCGSSYLAHFRRFWSYDSIFEKLLFYFFSTSFRLRLIFYTWYVGSILIKEFCVGATTSPSLTVFRFWLEFRKTIFFHLLSQLISDFYVLFPLSLYGKTVSAWNYSFYFVWNLCGWTFRSGLSVEVAISRALTAFWCWLIFRGCFRLFSYFCRIFFNYFLLK